MKFLNQQSSRAFTFAETMVVITIFTLVIGAITRMIYVFYVQNEYAVQQSAAITNGRDGVKNLVQDLREMVPSEGGAYPIELMTLDDITFYSDVDRDDAVERLRYFINGDNQLIRERTEPSGSPAIYDSDDTTTNIVASYIINDSFGTELFTYFDEEGKEVINLLDVDEVRFIEVNLIVNVDPNRQPEEFVIHSSAYLRNLKPTLQ